MSAALRTFVALNDGSTLGAEFTGMPAEAEPWRFTSTAAIAIRGKLLKNFFPLRERGFTDLLVRIAAPDLEGTAFTASIEVATGDERSELRVFDADARTHHVFIPLLELCAAPSTVRLQRLRPPDSYRNLAPAPADLSFTIEAQLANKSASWEALAGKILWVFGSARSGTTWLASDILGHGGRTRLMDETGIGRLIGALAWNAERSYDLAAKTRPFESGAAFEMHPERRAIRWPPPFERELWINFDRPTALLSQRTQPTLRRVVRDLLLEHVLLEWGLEDYDWVLFKMPNDSHAADFLTACFPESFVLFIARDGRDIMRSRFSAFASRELAETKDAALRMHAIAHYSHFWNFQTDIIRDAFEAHDPRRRLFVRYEDLRRNTGAEIRRILLLLGTKIQEEELRALVQKVTLENFPAEERGDHLPRQTGLIGSYVHRFNAAEIGLMNEIMAQNLRALGYVTDTPAVPPTKEGSPTVPDAEHDALEALKARIEGPVVLTSGHGLWPDGWLSRCFQVSVICQEAVCAVEIAGYAPDEWANNLLTVEIDGGMHPICITKPGTFSLRVPVDFPVRRTAQVSITAFKTARGVDVGAGTDERDLSVSLVGLKFLKAPEPTGNCLLVP